MRNKAWSRMQVVDMHCIGGYALHGAGHVVNQFFFLPSATMQCARVLHYKSSNHHKVHDVVGKAVEIFQAFQRVKKKKVTPNDPSGKEGPKEK